jgi:hypothetical protein
MICQGKRGVPQLIWTVVIALAISDATPLVAQQASSTDGQQRTEPSEARANTSSGQTDINNLPDSPGTIVAQAQQQSPPNNPTGAQPAANVPPPQQNQPAQSSSTSSQKPVGTAAAEAPNASGIAASQPAGVAIAPAKQHRVRTIVLRTGAIVGACVAVGAVVALTAGTPSKPPGAR